MSFSENLKSELTYQGILVKELASKTGINKRTLDNYLREKANVPPADTAVKIAKALNVSVEYLVTGNTPQVETNNTDLIFFAKYKGLRPRDKALIESLMNTMSDYSKLL